MKIKFIVILFFLVVLIMLLNPFSYIKNSDATKMIIIASYLQDYYKKSDIDKRFKIDKFYEILPDYIKAEFAVDSFVEGDENTKFIIDLKKRKYIKLNLSKRNLGNIKNKFDL